jgi:hypothetical protein
MVAPKKAAQPAKSRYAQMRDAARAKQKPVEPYEFDGTEPPTLITMPDTVDRVTAVAEMLDGDIGYGDMRRLFAAFCGDAFPTVWAVIKNEPFDVLIDLVTDMNAHFNAVPKDDDTPGGD